MEYESNKMKVEVWSDIMCPFCYIGKRHYEKALSQFTNRDAVEIVWHSYQLDPSIPKASDKKQNVFEYLAERKGITVNQALKMNERVLEMAKNAGLDFNLDQAIVANSFSAHRLIQRAKTKGLGDEAEESLFRAYFTEGKDFGNHEELVALGKAIGLSETDVDEALANDDYAYRVNQDIQDAHNLGIRGVPFFIFNSKYAVSGAQPAETFTSVLEKSFAEWTKERDKN
jgi:predicted DsbA family dithiol-disulfide isomerase